MRGWYRRHREGVQYLLWCALTTAVSWLSYNLYARLPLGASVVWLASTLSWLTAVTFSFVANKLRVFRSRSWKPSVVLPELVKFYSTRLLVGLLEIVLVPVLVWLGLDVPLFGVEGMLCKMLVTPVVILLNYTCGKWLVFRRKE